MNNEWNYIEDELHLLNKECHRENARIKVIFETSLLNWSRRINACDKASAATVDFVKTSTGFNGTGTDVSTVSFMNFCTGDELQIKASGSISCKADAIKLIKAEPTRIETCCASPQLD